MKSKNGLATFSAALAAILAASSGGLQAGGLQHAFNAVRSPYAAPARGPGWTVAQVKRMAKKARNRRRNKAAQKGGA